MHEPPEDTRAAVRGLCITRFAPQVISAQWDHVTLEGRMGEVRIDLRALLDPAQVRVVAGAVRAARTPDDLRFVASGGK